MNSVAGVWSFSGAAGAAGRAIFVGDAGTDGTGSELDMTAVFPDLGVIKPTSSVRAAVFQ